MRGLGHGIGRGDGDGLSVGGEEDSGVVGVGVLVGVTYSGFRVMSLFQLP